MFIRASILATALCATTTTAFVPSTGALRSSTVLREQIVSPFDDSSSGNGEDAGVATYTATEAVESDKGPLDLTWENVEMVLDGMRGYLIQDGGNVAITEIDGPVVRLELQVRRGRSSLSSNLFIHVDSL